MPLRRAQRLPLPVLTFILALAGCSSEAGFVPLFNGRDLSGWVNVNTAPSTWTVRDGMIVCSGIPTGVLRTERQYENFILELEWRHMSEGGNAGLFVHSDALPAPGQPFTRSTECQIMDGNHGDVFAIHGATMVPDRPHPRGWMRCLPSEERARPSPAWNHYRVESRDGRLTLAVNGKVVSGGSALNPRKGYICLESEGSEVHFRNIRIQELPSTHPPPERVAKVDQGFVSLYNGVDLSGWRQEAGQDGAWRADDWRLKGDATDGAQGNHLWSETPYGDFVLIADWRLGCDEAALPAEAAASGLFLRGSEKAQVPVGCGAPSSGGTGAGSASAVAAAVTPELLAASRRDAWNRYVITLRGERLTVALNGQTVVEEALLPGVPAQGRIGLAHHGAPVEFANLFIKELD